MPAAACLCSFLSTQSHHQVCLARVLLKRPKFLCLDEATASLDPKTEILFQKVLETSFADSTIICIAHRIDTLSWCRTRMEMRQGKLLSITAVGTDGAREADDLKLK